MTFSNTKVSTSGKCILVAKSFSDLVSTDHAAHNRKHYSSFVTVTTENALQPFVGKSNYAHAELKTAQIWLGGLLFGQEK